MKTMSLIIGSGLRLAAAGIVCWALAQPAVADDQKAAGGAGAPDMQQMMKKMEELAAPGPEHKLLASMAGEWQAEARCYTMGSDPMINKGTCKATMILGGRFLQEEFQGEMMGKKFTGMGLTGYDKFNKKFVSIWMDDMGTGITSSEGTADESGKVLTFQGKMDEPMTGEKGKPVRFVSRMISPDKRVFEMHDLVLGEKSKVMEIIYTRKAGALAGAK